MKKDVVQMNRLICVFTVIFLMSSCSDKDLYKYKKPKNADLYYGIPSYDISSYIKSIRVYKVDQPGFWSEKFLKNRWGLLAEIKDKTKLIKIINELKVSENEKSTGIYKGNEEYHLIFDYISGETAYLRLKRDINQQKFTVRPYAPMSYEINNPLVLLETIKGSDTNGTYLRQ